MKKITDFNQKDIEIIKNEYNSFNTLTKIAENFNCSRSIIKKLLTKEEIHIRHSSSYKTLKLPNTQLTEYQFQVLEGCLLGDSHLEIGKGVTPLFQHGSIHIEYINNIISILPFQNTKIYTKKAGQRVIEGRLCNCKESYSLQTLADRGLKDFYERWYPEGVKIVPKDLKLTPTTIRYWLYDDGYTSKKSKNPKHNTITIGLCTNGFIIEDCNFLVSKLKEIGLDFYIFYPNKKPVLITSKINTVRKFFDYIGNDCLECFKYKWKIPNNVNVKNG